MSPGPARRGWRRALAVGVLGVTCAVWALAAGTDAQRQMAAPCEACHGAEGRSAKPDVPSLAGQPKQFITTQLVMFREGNRKNAVMSPMAEPLNNADINELGSYFAAQSPAPGGKTLAADAAAAARGLAEKLNCVQCHGERGRRRDGGRRHRLDASERSQPARAAARPTAAGRADLRVRNREARAGA